MNTNNHSDNDSTKNQTEENQNSEANTDTSAETNEETTAQADNSTEPDYQTELLELKDKHLRLYSEFDNFRRRTAKEKIEHTQLANKNIMAALIPVLDDFQRAEVSINQAEDQDSKADIAFDAIGILQKRFRSVLEQQGLKEMESPVGKPLDTDVHEAITTTPAPSEDLKGKIVDQVEKGYFLNDKVVRFAKVVVGA
ncbi:molecular chaperone GrpE (heat shock protein) [Bernardetia litoralis DSM 6794]|uniref:Protein GrpE n=1 Tax=Bernardetia litoralis (strain ATCC 23117 / DSM 6794 / NBRC 15988 / NCIMB 1366 / Fx l1 / Sio-4) TaxID=880071 RepID=I4AQX5_BERLS|nr:nucleotide exchange factor GrpE [Bernardetia litoralis]AFM06360.1 molecular chaperone GrpE (heat shock protein) [Bernardetia litoralis DSM 6794]